MWNLSLMIMSKKLEKLREINETITKRCTDLETYMFVENIPNVSVEKIREDNQVMVIEVK